ncbi:MAG: tetratricopeptide repeat protein [Nostoc sp.]|uniref:tetratricopeptide repeat protein n=1 Tax=Nostoc sp. TaxID=1180 RepID=UPI002FF77F44
MEWLERSTKVESPGVLKAGNPNKSLAYWQGRKTEIAQIQQWLTDKNTFLIGIEGIGGTGKSILATKIYDEIAGFPKRFWADVSYGAGFSDLARQVLSEFGFLVPEQEAQLVEALVGCLRSGQFLLIIDNLESLLQPDRQWGSLFYGDFFQAWVEYGGNSKVIVTTRERPELKGFEWLTLKGLQVDEGVALLTVLGIRGDLTQFVESVDGHPLLLRLVADLLKEEYSQDPDLSRLADLGLGNLRQLLTDPQVVGVHRRENVGMVLVLDASFNRLNELQKALLLNISVYRGAVDSAAAVAMLPGSSAPEIEKELRNLVKRSLLLEKLNGKRRFEFQPVVLEYARYKAGNQTEAHEQAIDYYHSNLKQEPWQTKEDIKEYLEIFYHCCQLENYHAAFDILGYCNNFLNLRGYFTIKVKLYNQLIEAWELRSNNEHDDYRFALNSLGVGYASLGEHQLALQIHKVSLEIANTLGNYPEKLVALGNLGVAYKSLNLFDAAIDAYEESMKIAREISDEKAEAKSLTNLSNVYYLKGEIQLAWKFQQKSLEILKKINNLEGETKSLANLANMYYSGGEYRKAVELYQECLHIAKEKGYQAIEASIWSNLGRALVRDNRVEDALGAYCNARELYQDMELEKEVQLCNNAIERLSQPITPVVSRRGFWVWLRRLWRWVRSWFRQ